MPRGRPEPIQDAPGDLHEDRSPVTDHSAADDMLQLELLIQSIEHVLDESRDVDDIMGNLRSHTQHLAGFLVDADKAIVAHAFAFVERLHDALGPVNVAPILLDWLRAIAFSDDAMTKVAVQAVAALSVYSMHALSECYDSLVHADAASVDAWFGMVLYEVARSSDLLAGLSSTQFITYMQILLIHLATPSLTESISLTFHVVSEKQPDQFNAWFLACDEESMRHMLTLMPDSRSMAKRYAQHRKQTSFTTSVASSLGSTLRQSRLQDSRRLGDSRAQPSTSHFRNPTRATTPTTDDTHDKPVDAKKRPIERIGRRSLNESALSEISPLNQSIKVLSPRPTKPATGLLFTTPTPVPSTTMARQPDEEASPFDDDDDNDDADATEAPPSTAIDATLVLYVLVAASVLFAMYGLTAGALLISQDFTAWQQRMALNKYRVSVERSLAEVARVADVVHAWRLGVTDTVAASSSTTDHDRAQSVYSIWRAIDDELHLPRL
ncbi:hypothetical protein SPRG_06395 [Saprolegnia parasitica CBS 223.65]|uniref:Uncharacterized protein n=1 Tax=Saprolegnia parasitica (strain CBS 223.65) TaxID=695850 RepID=A0A067CNY9_SAPPC|nr:hypothetical protein SPRG_06395 [Saprolegnia parasitica CBS 223.65]KDO28537.1 hypothetical protein SPRG_06395 [Saprolegnia parasitica CBS 223.65]|eukprot:XP_012200603.1 hypothetical protein SPRG_06395 [Saprolegnia parasitica CBS 223.65]